MAKVKGIFGIKGSLQNVSFYTMRGSDEIILRAKGGPKKSTIKRSARFETVRKNNNEWKGCTMLASQIKRAFGLSGLADYPVIGSLNALAKKIQLYDQENPQGERSLLLSQHKELIAGFNLNKTHPFDSVFRVALNYTVDRDNFTAHITVPRINTDVHLVNYRNLPLFRIKMTMCTQSDIALDNDRKNYCLINEKINHYGIWKNSEWLPTQGVLEEQIFELKQTLQDNQKLDENMSLIFSVGIEFGTVGNDGNPIEVKYTGCAKVLAVV